MANIVTRAQETISEDIDGLADRATGLIGAAAGTVVDPKAGSRRALGRMTSPAGLVLLVAIALLAVAVLRWKKGS